jgi:hypothetical protein
MMVKREHKKKLSRAELEQITSRRPVTRKILLGPGPDEHVSQNAM